MSDVALSSALPAPSRGRAPIVPNGVLGMLIFVITEAMFFAGLISAHTIAESSAPYGWPPPDQPRLPLEATAVNTLALLVSGVCLFVAGRSFRKDPESAKPPFAVGLFLGAFFVFAQGIEWVGLVREGLTLFSSTHGSFFYLIVGSHAFHAVVAIGLLLWAFTSLLRSKLTDAAFTTLRVFWYFVVLVWPFLYLKVYL